MAEKSKEKEDSVLFSLRELKTLATEPKKAETRAEPAAPRAEEPRPASLKAHEPDEKESDALVMEALSSLRSRVEQERRRVEEARRRAEEQRRLTEELARLEEDLRKAEAERARHAEERARREGEVARLRDRAAGDLATVEEPPPPRGVVLRPPVLVGLTLLVAGLAGLSIYAFTRPPAVQVVTRGGVAAPTAAVPAIAREFGPEISWLDVGDVAAPTVTPADEGDEGEDETPRRRPVRRRPAAASDEGKPGKPRFVPPEKKPGFIY